MRSSAVLSAALLLAASCLTPTAEAAVSQGFNYGSTQSDGTTPVTESQFEAAFNAAKNLPGTNGAFTSARLFTCIQGGTTNTPTSAIQAAINTKTTLLLTMWASSGQSGFDNELAALNSAISQYGSAFTNLVAGLSVGSEDLYRITPTSTQNNGGTPMAGADGPTIAGYISQVRSALKTANLNWPVGHVDTWTAWNGTYGVDPSAVISAVDWIGMDAYPYFEFTTNNAISQDQYRFQSAYQNCTAVSQGKPVWVTETGWPVSGPTENQATPNTANAKQYWDDVGCVTLFGKINTWWYTLSDSPQPSTSPSFGIVSSVGSAPLFDLTCPSS